MKILNYKDIVTSSDDDFLYDRLIRLLQEMKLAQGGTALDSTLRRHAMIRNYILAKQFSFISRIEENCFMGDGSLNLEYITSRNVKVS